MHTKDAIYSASPHGGGFIWKNPAELAIFSSATLPVLGREAVGKYSISRTAGAAETIQLAGSLSFPRRPVRETDPHVTLADKDVTIDDIVVAYEVGVVALTSMTLRLSSVVYADNVAPAITAATIPATPAFTLAARANEYVIKKTLATALQLVADLSEINFEVEFVMANTGTLKFRGIGFHCHFNWT